MSTFLHTATFPRAHPRVAASDLGSRGRRFVALSHPPGRAFVGWLLLTSAWLGFQPLTPIRAADFLSAGPLYQEFYQTLNSGSRIEAFGPLFYEEQVDTVKTWAVPPLISYTTDTSVDLKELDILYPFLTYDRYGPQYRWQFCQLLSFAGGPHQDDPSRKRFTLFPIYFQQRSMKPEENYTAVFPFYGRLRYRLFREDIFFVMFPIYGQTKKHDVVTDNYMFPFFHLRHGPGLNGWQFWPLMGREHKEVTTSTNGFGDLEMKPGYDTQFVLWPFYFNDHTRLGTTNATWISGVLPFYCFERSALRDSTSIFWPFFSKIDDREKKYREVDAPWPLIVFAHGEGKTTTRVWPFFSQAHTPTYEDNFYLWPIYKYTRAQSAPLDRKRTRIAFFVYSDTVDKNTERDVTSRRTYLLPFFYRQRDFNGNTRLQVIAPYEPFVQGSHKIPRDFSPIWSVWRQENNPTTGAASQSLLWNLYRRETSPAYKKVSLLFGLFQYQSGPEGARTRLFYVPLGGHGAATMNAPKQ